VKGFFFLSVLALASGSLTSCTSVLPELVSTEMSFELKREVYGIPMSARYTIGGKKGAKAPVLIDPVK